mgnify:CR=1 FL=1
MTGKRANRPDPSVATATATPSARPRSGLATGLRVLETIAASPEAPSLTQIAERLGMSKPGIHASIATLLQRGYVNRDAAGHYVIGLRAWELGARLPFAAIAHAASGPMSGLARDFGEGAILGVLDGWDVVYLQVYESTHPVRVHADPGARIPAHCTSTGLALLSALTPAEVARRRPKNLEAFSPATITSVEGLDAELARIRRDGFAVNMGGWRADVGGMATCVRGGHGNTALAGLCVAAPLYRITPDWLTQARAALGGTAAEIGRAMDRG